MVEVVVLVGKNKLVVIFSPLFSRMTYFGCYANGAKQGRHIFQDFSCFSLVRLFGCRMVFPHSGFIKGVRCYISDELYSFGGRILRMNTDINEWVIFGLAETSSVCLERSSICCANYFYCTSQRLSSDAIGSSQNTVVFNHHGS